MCGVVAGVSLAIVLGASSAADAARWSELLYYWSDRDKSEVSEREKPRASFSFGSFFGDNSENHSNHDTADRFAADPSGPNLNNLSSQAGGQWAFMTLRTQRMRHIRAFQIGGFRVGGLGAGFDDTSTQTVNVATEKIIPGYYTKQCVYVPAQTIVVNEEQNLTGASDTDMDLGGVEFNMMFREKIDFAGISGLETFAGARYIEFGNKYSASFANSGAGGASGATSGFSSVTNNLVGAQVGVSGRHFFSKDVMLTGRLAFGLFANFIDQGGEVNSSESQNLTSAQEQDDTGFAQMVEFSPTLHIRLQEKMFLSFGGTMMWLNGINRASKDYVNGFSTDGGATDANQSYFYYGGKATLKWTFN